MFKACGLGSGVSLLYPPSLRPWTLTVARSFATTSNVPHHRTLRPTASRMRDRPTNRRNDGPLAIGTNELGNDEWHKPTPPSTRPIERELYVDTERGTAKVTFSPKLHDDSKAARPENANEDSSMPPNQTDWENEAVYDYQDESKEPAHIRTQSKFYQEIRARQYFHLHINLTLLENIMQREPVLRGMPVYDSTFNAVRSGKNLFIKAPGPVRSLQYLLPAANSILEFGPCKHRRAPEPGARLPLRPLSLLVLCPTLGEAEDVQKMGTMLVKGHRGGMKVVAMDPPKRQLDAFSSGGANVLTTTPGILLQWLALSHTKAFLHDFLKDVQLLVVDGRAYALRNGDFLELLDAVMEDIPLPKETQRVIISDEYDSQLDGPLTRRFFPAGYESHYGPRLEEIQALRGARQEKKQEHQRRRKKHKRGRRKTLASLKDEDSAERKTGSHHFLNDDT